MTGLKNHCEVHSFYQLQKSAQWILATLMALLLLTLVGFWTALVYQHFWLYASIVLIAPFMQFLATPLFTLAGIYQYLSPMLLVYMPTAKKYDLHNGTSFDYLFIMQKYRFGRPFRYQLLRYYLEGLLTIIEKIEKGQLPDTIVIRGSSYFFSERTARKLGFDVRKAHFHEQLNIAINYLDLLWMYSLAHRRITFPKLARVKTAEIRGDALVEHKAVLQNMFKQIEQTNQ